jgi:hypothetical protein
MRRAPPARQPSTSAVTHRFSKMTTAAMPPGYVDNGVLGYVMPATAGAVQVPGTQPWYWMREAGQSAGAKHDYFYTSDPVYQRLPAMASVYEYKDFGVNAWLFTHGPDDRTAPAIILSGALYSNRDRFVAEGTYGLQIRVTDGVAGGSVAPQGSGAKRVDVSVNGAKAYSTGDLPCSSPEGSCACTGTFTLNTREWPAGDLDVTVRALDQEGNATKQTLTVFTDPDRDLVEFGSDALDIPDPIATTASTGVTYGIAAEPARSAFFGSSLFQSLGVTAVRTSVEWDVVVEALGSPPAGSTPQQQAAYYDLRYKPAPR